MAKTYRGPKFDEIMVLRSIPRPRTPKKRQNRVSHHRNAHRAHLHPPPGTVLPLVDRINLFQSRTTRNQLVRKWVYSRISAKRESINSSTSTANCVRSRASKRVSRTNSTVCKLAPLTTKAAQSRLVYDICSDLECPLRAQPPKTETVVHRSPVKAATLKYCMIVWKTRC